MTCTKEQLNYIDITDKWLKNSKPNNYEVKNMSYFKHEGIKYQVDGKNVVLDYSLKEREVANWLKAIFGGKICMCPRINNPEGIRTPDYIYKTEKWDLKTITGNSKQTLYHSIIKNKGQSNNFIFDITNSKLKIKEAVHQINNLYKRKDTYFLDKAIIKKYNNFCVLQRKKECDCTGNSAQPHSL